MYVDIYTLTKTQLHIWKFYKNKEKRCSYKYEKKGLIKYFQIPIIFNHKGHFMRNADILLHMLNSWQILLVFDLKKQS